MVCELNGVNLVEPAIHFIYGKGLEHVDLKMHNELKVLKKNAILLDRFYITTRIPNGFPELTPEEAYLEEDAINCIDNANRIIEAVKALLA